MHVIFLIAKKLLEKRNINNKMRYASYLQKNALEKRAAQVHWYCGLIHTVLTGSNDRFLWLKWRVSKSQKNPVTRDIHATIDEACQSEYDIP